MDLVRRVGLSPNVRKKQVSEISSQHQTMSKIFVSQSFYDYLNHMSPKTTTFTVCLSVTDERSDIWCTALRANREM